jgi:hypothetical protein
MPTVKLALGGIWLLALRIATVVAPPPCSSRPLAAHARERLSGFILLAGVLGVCAPASAGPPVPADANPREGRCRGLALRRM